MSDSNATSPVFISYSRANGDFVARLIPGLEARGVRVWIDRQGLKAGTPDWEEALREAIRASQAVLLIASPDSRRSRYVKDELDIAAMYGRPIIPVWASGDQWMDCIPIGLGHAEYIDARDAAFAGAASDIASALGSHAGLPPSSSGTLPVGEIGAQSDQVAAGGVPFAAKPSTVPHDFVPRNPFKGLRAFTLEDAGDFFGRDRLIGELVDQVGQRQTEGARFLSVVIGPSGSGKSSVVMAGLLPRLKVGALPGSGQWLYLDPIVPGNHPVEALAVALAGVFPDRAVKTIREDLDDDSARGLHVLASRVVGSPDRHVVLVIDQFEELFTLAADEAERRHFIDLVVTAVTEPRGPLFAILTLRADFYDRPLKYPELGKLIESYSRTVLPMSVEELREAIVKPVALPDVRLTFDDGLVGDLLFEVRDEPAALPLLQFTLDQLFARRDGQRLTSAAYREIGGVRGALAKHAETTFAGLSSDEHRRLARALFLRLIELGTTEQDTTRRRAAFTELLLSDPAQTQIMREVADTFVAARLLATNRIGQTDTIEVSHEALIREWQRLGDWLREAREDVRLQGGLTLDAAEWVQRGRLPGDDLLYRGSVLEAARRWAERYTPSADESAFLNASMAEQARQASLERDRQQHELALQRRIASSLRYIVIILTLALVGAAALTTFAFNQRQRVQDNLARSESLRLASEATGLLGAGGDVVTATLLAIRAIHSTYTPQADLALTRAWHQNDTIFGFVGHAGAIYSVAISPDGRYALTGSGDTLAALWNTQTGKGIRVFKGHTLLVSSVTFSPDGKLVLTGSDDGTARLWTTETGEQQKVFSGNSGGVRGVAYSPDGKFILTACGDGTVRMWDTANASLVRTFSGHSQGVNRVVISHDGQYGLTGSDDGTVRLWKLDTGDLISILASQAEAVTSVAFAPDGQSVLLGTKTGVVQKWNTQAGTA